MTVVQYHQRETFSPLTLSTAAANHLIKYLQKDSAYRGVRFSVKKSGCSGLSYVIDYVTSQVEGDLQHDYVQQLTPEYNIYIDAKSYEYLKGMYIDYVQQGLNYKFIFNNPNQTGQCGCGESFTVAE